MKNADAKEHPFLICRRDEFEALRERARFEPWATMKRNAFIRIEKGLNADQREISPVRVQRFLGACALAYILKPRSSPDYAERIWRAITEHLAALDFDEEKSWNGVVPPMGAAFVAIIALDVAYADLTETQIQKCETVIQRQIENISRDGAWLLARRGTHETWAIYNGERTSPDDAYYEHFVRQITPDGVMTTATNYAWARLASNTGRLQKTGYADVLEFTGVDNRYYDNPRLKKFYRWLYGYSVTPARQLHAFGDFIPGGIPNAVLAYRAGRFDDEAARYMTWAMQDHQPPGHIMSYVLRERNYAPEVPTSRVYADGGAFFREPEDSSASLGAALYNITAPAQWHAHQETNALSLSAYGARLLMNGGWLGPVTRPAPHQNTLTINGKEHASRSGGGVEGGLTGDGFDYAVGLSDHALPEGASFKRRLMLVHGQDDANGYFVVVDGVKAHADDVVNTYIHPSTDVEPDVLRSSTEYDARSNLFNEVEDTRLAVFYGTEPENVEMSLSPSSSERASRPEHYRLEATYAVDESGEADIVTVLLPHDEDHQKASLERLSAGGMDGVRVEHDGAVDRVFAGKGRVECTVSENVSFQGKSVVYRMVGQKTPFYFVGGGCKFRNGAIGFTSEKSVSLHMRGNTGRITTAQDVMVTFYHPRLHGVTLEGKSLEKQDSGEGWARVVIPEGNNRRVVLAREATK